MAATILLVLVYDTGIAGAAIAAVRAMEAAVVESDLDWLILRGGLFYGPGTGFNERTGWAPVHVDAAAQAALLAIECAKTGVFNIAEDSGYVSIVKARQELGWDPDFRLRDGLSFHATARPYTNV